jgi:hypothetical protein
MRNSEIHIPHSELAELRSSAPQSKRILGQSSGIVKTEQTFRSSRLAVVPEPTTTAFMRRFEARIPGTGTEPRGSRSDELVALDEPHDYQYQRNHQQDVNQPAQEMQADTDNPENEQNSDYPPHLAFSCLILAVKPGNGKRSVGIQATVRY